MDYRDSTIIATTPIFILRCARPGHGGYSEEGQFSTPEIGPLKRWRPFLEVETGGWAEHSRYGLVPRFSIHNHGVKDLELTQGFLELPLGTASENDIVFADVEHKSELS